MDGYEKLKDLSRYSEYLNILTKDSRQIPLSFNGYQLKLWDKIKELRSQNKPVRIIVLKARQLGISTFSTALTYHSCATSRYKKGVIIANDADSTSNLFNMCSRYHDYLPGVIKPMKRYSNKKELVFENPDDILRTETPGLVSRIQVETANKDTAGRSGTITDLHMSEVAFWRNPAVVMTGLLQSVPRLKGTTVIIESTANGIAGMGEEFYNRWKSAEEGKSDYVPVFFPWHDNPEYELHDPSFKITKDELEIQRRLPSINNNKLAWRRWKISNEMGSALLEPEDQFRQEYPSTSEEAFIMSGRSVFNINLINDLISRASTKQFKRGEI